MAPAIVFSSMVIEPHYAVLLALVTACYCKFQIFPFALRHGDWKVARPMFLAGFRHRRRRFHLQEPGAGVADHLPRHRHGGDRRPRPLPSDGTAGRQV